MFITQDQDNSIMFEFSSDQRHVDRILRECAPFFTRWGITPTQDLKLVLREMLNNAVEHGNKNNLDEPIRCTVERIRDTLFKITVEDRGEGFNHRDLDFSMPDDPYQNRHRGLALVNTYADKLEFNREGNVVTAYMDIRKETTFEITEDGEARIITPSGSMSASNAEDFRKTVSDMLSSGITDFIFDFSQVPDIDSVSLSVLIGFAKTLSKNKSDAVPAIVNASGDIVDLFHMTAMDRIFSVESPAE